MEKSDLDRTSEIYLKRDSFETTSEIADYGNNKFLRLKDVDISAVPTVEFGNLSSK
jgi:hypothetical protein